MVIHLISHVYDPNSYDLCGLHYVCHTVASTNDTDGNKADHHLQVQQMGSEGVEMIDLPQSDQFGLQYQNDSGHDSKLPTKSNKYKKWSNWWVLNDATKAGVASMSPGNDAPDHF